MGSGANVFDAARERNVIVTETKNRHFSAQMMAKLVVFTLTIGMQHPERRTNAMIQTTRNNPNARTRPKFAGAGMCVGVAIAAIAGMLGVAGSADEARSATSAFDAVQENPVAKARPGPKLAESCTIDAVPNSNGSGGGFGFTGPAHFHEDGRMTCHRAKLTLRFKGGFSSIRVRSCSGSRYVFSAVRGGARKTVTFNPYSGQVVSVR